MANVKISALTASGIPDPLDLFVVVDVSDSSMAASGTDKKVTTTQIFTKPTINGSIVAPTTYSPVAAGTATLDLAASNRHSITMPAGNITIALSNVSTNQIFMVEITQDGVGSRTVTWFSTIRWTQGTEPVLTTTASKRDSFGFVCTGTGTYDGYIIGQFV